MRIEIISAEGIQQSYNVVDLAREITEGRVSLSCLARIEGSSQWKPLKDIPDVLNIALPPENQPLCSSSIPASNAPAPGTNPVRTDDKPIKPASQPAAGLISWEIVAIGVVLMLMLTLMGSKLVTKPFLFGLWVIGFVCCGFMARRWATPSRPFWSHIWTVGFGLCLVTFFMRGDMTINRWFEMSQLIIISVIAAGVALHFILWIWPDGIPFDNNPATASVKSTTTALVVFYFARQFILAHLNENFGGFAGGIDALAHSDDYLMWQKISDWVTIAYAIIWVIFFLFLSVWIYNSFQAKQETPAENLRPQEKN